MQPGAARLVNAGDGKAEVYLRPCSVNGDTLELRLADDATRRGVLRIGFISGFEFIYIDLALENGAVSVRTHEFHKDQPRAVAAIAPGSSTVVLERHADALPGLPYEGSKLTLHMDGEQVLSVGAIDYLPESHVMFGLQGKGEVTLRSLAISGPARPQPEYAHVGLWQQAPKASIRENADGLLAGIREAAQAGVRILVTPETSFTGLPKPGRPMPNRAVIQAELTRFQQAVAQIASAPFTLIGYPEWIEGGTVAGSTLDAVPVNCHRFICPDGALGPMMAKVHSCEEGLWHGRHYNLQEVEGVKVAVGVCHDGHYQDVWATGIMGGARLCLHPAAGGQLSGHILDIVRSYQSLGTPYCAYWLRVTAGGGAAIVYPQRTAKVVDTVLAVPADLTEANPTWPEYSPMGDLLAHAVIRLWEANGAYPLRTLRSGSKYDVWQQLVPECRKV